MGQCLARWHQVLQEKTTYPDRIKTDKNPPKRCKLVKPELTGSTSSRIRPQKPISIITKIKTTAMVKKNGMCKKTHAVGKVARSHAKDSTQKDNNCLASTKHSPMWSPHITTKMAQCNNAAASKWRINPKSESSLLGTQLLMSSALQQTATNSTCWW